MLQGWMPSRWALLGGILAMLNLAIVSYWMNSYWGGSMAAIGGALVLGSLPRIERKRRVSDALIMGLGIALLANSRPLEGSIFCLPVAASLLVWLAGKYSPPIQVTALRVMAPLITALLITGAFIAYYDWSVTGNPLLLPHSLNLKTYYSTPLFIWEKLRPPMHYNNRQFDDFYNGWVRDNFHGSVRDILRVSWEKVRAYPSAFLWSSCSSGIATGIARPEDTAVGSGTRRVWRGTLPGCLFHATLRRGFDLRHLCAARAGGSSSEDRPLERPPDGHCVVARIRDAADYGNGIQSLSCGALSQRSLRLVVGQVPRQRCPTANRSFPGR
jgi:hypothetical protein